MEVDSNILYIRCPFCNNLLISSSLGKKIEELARVHDQNEDFFQCSFCYEFIKISVIIYKEIEYTVEKPSPEEIKLFNLYTEKIPEGKIKDIPGQMILWDK